MSLRATLPLSAACFVGPVALTSGQAGATRLPRGISDRCTGFTGTAAGTTDFLSGFRSGGQRRGTGTIARASTAHTIRCTKPFEGGASVELVNITAAPGGADEPETQGCPATRPVEVLVGGMVGPHSNDAGAKVSAGICVSLTAEFLEEPGSFFTIAEP